MIVYGMYTNRNEANTVSCSHEWIKLYLTYEA